MFNDQSDPASAIWKDVPEPQQQVNFIVDEPQENTFTALIDEEVAGQDVIETLYMLTGIWRIVIDDNDDDEDVPSALIEITVDRRFKVEEVRTAVIKLLENLYSLEEG